MAGKTENNKKIRLLFFILSVQMSFLHLTYAKPQINLGKFSFDQFQFTVGLKPTEGEKKVEAIWPLDFKNLI